MKHVDLCSGIGGFALGFEWAGLSQPVLFCDIEPWSRQVLAKHWPDVPISDDVKELASDAGRLVPDCDILTAGYPCQPFSVAGQQRGAEDDRHIWPEIFAIVQAKRPAWCVFENVSGHITLGLDEVLSDLEGQDYTCQAFIVPACAVDAPHRRDRVWIVANSDNAGQSASSGPRQGNRKQAWDDTRRSSTNVGNSDSSQCCWDIKATEQGGRQQGLAARRENVADTNSQRGCSVDTRGMEAWLPEPAVGRVAHGVPRRVDRLKGLGNAIVPQIAMRIGQTIKAVEDGQV
jgi:DNA (cytosine-5)-methyltransferase 1